MNLDSRLLLHNDLPTRLQLNKKLLLGEALNHVLVNVDAIIVSVVGRQESPIHNALEFDALALPFDLPQLLAMV